MKRRLILIFLLLLLSCIAGYLLSKASLVGRVGINLFYKEYKFLKMWWQGAGLIFIIWMILFFVQGLVQRKMQPPAFKLIQIATIIIALAGLYFTYSDFRHTTSHRWLGERFHIGGYIFWIGWIIISMFYLIEKKETVISQGGQETNNPNHIVS